MEHTIDRLRAEWQTRLLLAYPQQPSVQMSILNWLIGVDRTYWNMLTDRDLELAKQRVEARFETLTQRYLNFNTAHRYRHLMQRLGTCIVKSTEIELPASDDRVRTEMVVDLIEKVLEQMCKTDPYIQSRIQRIGCCTNDLQLHAALLSSDLELYCQQQTGTRLLLVERCRDYLQRDRARGSRLSSSKDRSILDRSTGTKRHK
jgi:hypothetical protein